MAVEANAYLDKVSRKPDDKVEVAPAAVALSALERPGLSLESYFTHLKSLIRDVGERHRALIEAKAGDTVETQLAALKHVLADFHGYYGDEEDPGVINSDMIEVIDRRKGSPLALCILYLHAGKAQGWDISVMRIPGHNVLRLEKDGKRLIFDPSAGCKLLQAADLRSYVKRALWGDAELSADYYEPPGNRELLMRLQNILKFRRIELEDYEGALRIVQGLQIVDPEEYRLLLDAGVLYARSNRPREAIAALESYIDKTPDAREVHWQF